MVSGNNGGPRSGKRHRHPLTNWYRYHQDARHERGTGRGRGALFPLLFSFMIAVTIAVFAFVGFVATAFARFTDELPSVTNLTDRGGFQTTKIYDRTGQVLLYEIFDPQGGKRTKVELRDMPAWMIAAQLAAEDKNFYTNPGFDPFAMSRALVGNLTGGGISSGASTITQQVVRNTLFPFEERYKASYVRKAKEVVLSFFVNQKYSKDEILELYFNEVYYGNLAYGIDAAAEAYFGKPVRDVTLAEAAMLAGLPQAPSAYNPFVNPSSAKERQIYVLQRMVEDGYITYDQAVEAAKAPLHFKRQNGAIRAPHFVFYIRDQLEQKYGRDRIYHDGLKVITTLDVRMQEIGERIVATQVEDIKKRHLGANNAALVAIDPNTAEILTMVGSADYYDESIDGQVNVAVSPRQPGSTLKPIVYSLAFMQGWSPGTLLDDSPLALPDNNRLWTPVNWDGAFHGSVSVRRALGNSYNIPAIKTLQFVGLRPFVRKAREMGLKSLREDGVYGMSVVIGGAEVLPVELANAYSVFAAGGIFRPAVSILQVTDNQGNLLESYRVPPGQRVLPQAITYMITDILTDGPNRTETYGPPPSKLDLSRPAAAKTGTTDSSRDLWLAGYTPDLVGVVWVGNARGGSTQRLFGGTTAAPIWHDFMEEALASRPPRPFTKPDKFDDSILHRTPTPTPRTAVPATTPAPVTTPVPGQPTPVPAPVRPTPVAAQGPAIVVPNVVGLPEAEARVRLSAAGLTPGQYSNYQGHDVLQDRVLRTVCIGCVLSTSPGGGAQAARGTTVYLAVRKD